MREMWTNSMRNTLGIWKMRSYTFAAVYGCNEKFNICEMDEVILRVRLRRGYFFEFGRNFGIFRIWSKFVKYWKKMQLDSFKRLRNELFKGIFSLKYIVGETSNCIKNEVQRQKLYIFLMQKNLTKTSDILFLEQKQIGFYWISLEQIALRYKQFDIRARLKYELK